MPYACYCGDTNDIAVGLTNSVTCSFEVPYSFLVTFDPKWCADRTLILLLIACALFTPTRTEIHDKETIAAANERYKVILFRCISMLYLNKENTLQLSPRHVFSLQGASSLRVQSVHAETGRISRVERGADACDADGGSGAHSRRSITV